MIDLEKESLWAADVDSNYMQHRELVLFKLLEIDDEDQQILFDVWLGEEKPEEKKCICSGYCEHAPLETAKLTCGCFQEWLALRGYIVKVV